MEIEKTEPKKLTFEEEIENRIKYYRKLAEKLDVPTSEVTAAITINELVLLNQNINSMHEHLDKHLPIEQKPETKEE